MPGGSVHPSAQNETDDSKDCQKVSGIHGCSHPQLRYLSVSAFLRLWCEVDYRKQDDGDGERYRRYRQVPVYPFKPGRAFV